jgi:anthranilate synthase component II
MNILVFDNYDSFTYNLVQVLRELGHGADLTVRRNDQLDLDEVEAYDAVLLSPGPGIPAEAGLMPGLIQRYAPSKRILGVCLGHQGIAESFGAALVNLAEVHHGVASQTTVAQPDERLFRGLPAQFQVGRYHSWAVRPDSLPACLEVTAHDDAGEIMALRHREYDVRGVQFHPESVLTEHGHRLIKNWLNG